ncbi:MAG TPA: hypothetical protein VF043_34340 [Ktedonobacteraceae bacterium]
MDQEQQDQEAPRESEQAQTELLFNQYPSELVEAIRQTTFTTLAVASARGFTDLKITAIRKLGDDFYAVRFTYVTLNRVERETQWITTRTVTEGRGLYVHEFAPALYLDAYAIANFAQDLVHPPSHD